MFEWNSDTLRCDTIAVVEVTAGVEFDATRSLGLLLEVRLRRPLCACMSFYCEVRLRRRCVRVRVFLL